VFLKIWGKSHKSSAGHVCTYTDCYRGLRAAAGAVLLVAFVDGLQSKRCGHTVDVLPLCDRLTLEKNLQPGIPWAFSIQSFIYSCLAGAWGCTFGVLLFACT